MEKLDFNQMELVEGGKPCWLATTEFLAAGLGTAVAIVETGGLAIIVGAPALGGLYYDYLEACYPEMLE